MSRWLEHDAWDQLPKKPVVVVLCRQCSTREIEAHARLYKEIPQGASVPGCMSVCTRCRFRDGVSCSSPAAKVNGGPGLQMKWEKSPTWCHLNFGGGHGTTGYIYAGPVISCSGREVRS